MQFIQVNSPEEGYQIDSDEMAVSANKEPTKRAPANHSAVLKYQFETPSKLIVIKFLLRANNSNCV